MIKEMRQLQWAYTVQTGTQANVTMIPAKAGHKVIIYVVVIGSNESSNVGGIVDIVDNTGGVEFASFVYGRGAPTPIYCVVKSTITNDDVDLNIAGTANAEISVLLGYTYEPDPTPRHM